MAVAVASDNPKLKTPSFEEINRSCERLAQAVPGDTRDLACLLSKMNLRYYSDVLNQANQSFRAAVIAAVVGVGFFIAAASWAMNKEKIAWTGLIAGSAIQILSGTCFYLYRQASIQFASFHICLDRSNRFVLADTICEKLPPPTQEQARASLVHTIAQATLLTPDVVSGKTRVEVNERRESAKG